MGPPLTGFLVENYGWGIATIPLAIASLVGMCLMLAVKLHNHEKQSA
jgi:sugar phosphate permease